jgi:hypothetical protein
MRSSRLLIAGLLAVATIWSPALARKGSTTLALEYRPTEETAHVGQLLPAAMRQRSVELQVRDGRGLEDATVIGTRSDNDDQIQILRATGGVIPFVLEALNHLTQEWGVPTGAGSELLLELELIKFKITETDKAVGSNYNSEAQLKIVLRDLAGNALWTAEIFGDASRYGRKGSIDNTNEVLSDALAEAVVSAFEHRNLQAAWSSGQPPAAPVGLKSP